MRHAGGQKVSNAPLDGGGCARAHVALYALRESGRLSITVAMPDALRVTVKVVMAAQVLTAHKVAFIITTGALARQDPK